VDPSLAAVVASLARDVSMALLIVNADDYGLTAGVNRGIELAHNRGIVTSTSAMVNQPASEQVASLSARHAELGVGLHLTFTAGTPVLDPATVPTLVDEEGRFWPRNTLVRRLERREVDPDNLRREALAQLERLTAFGVAPDHWNVHQHLQEWLPVAVSTAHAMREGGLSVCRTSRRYTLTATPRERAVEAVRTARRHRALRELTRFHRTPDRLMDLDPSRWGRALPALPKGRIVEALCHPGERGDVDLALTAAKLADTRATELEALLDPTLREALATAGVTLATFAQAFRAARWRS